MLNKDLQTFKADDIIILSKRKEGYKMTRVLVNGNMDGALRKFKQKVARSGVPSEVKKKRQYSKPGVRRREAIKEGIKNSRKRNSKRY